MKNEISRLHKEFESPLDFEVNQKAWIYLEETFVLELDYLGKQFAFDVKMYAGGGYIIELVWRNCNIQYKKFLKWRAQCSFENIRTKIGLKLNEIKIFLDKYSQIKVSVVVPVHNREKIIYPLLRSFNNQDYDKSFWEIIFVDDGSTDSTCEVIEEYCSRNYYIIKRDVASGNASTPRNEGITIAKGDYILFVDSDDYLNPKTIRSAYEYAKNNDSDLVYLKTKGINREFHSWTYTKGNIPNAEIFADWLLSTAQPSKLISHKALIKYNILFDPSIDIGEDQIFIFQLVAFCKKISILADDDYVFLVGHDENHLSLVRDRKPYPTYYIYSRLLVCLDLITSEKKKYEFFNNLYYRFSIRCRNIDFENFMSDNYTELYIVNKMFSRYKELYRENLIYKYGLSTIQKLISFWR